MKELGLNLSASQQDNAGDGLFSVWQKFIGINRESVKDRTLEASLLNDYASIATHIGTKGDSFSQKLYLKYAATDDLAVKVVIAFILYLTHATNLAKPIIDIILSSGFDSHKHRDLSSVSAPKNIGKPAYACIRGAHALD